MQLKRFLSVVVLILLMTGCDMQKNPTELMRAPVLSNDLNQLHNAVTSQLLEGGQVYIPLNSESSVAIKEIDLDSDGIMEAYATYKVEKKYEKNFGVIILGQTDNGWTKLNQIEIQGNDIDFIRFDDLDKDGQLEMMLGIVETNDMNKTMHLYKLENQIYSQIETLPYEKIEVGNLNEDLQDEIIILRNNRYEMTADASVYHYDGKSLLLVDKLPLDGSINDFSDVKVGKASSTQNGVFIEVGVGAHSAYSILLIMKDGKLKDVFNTSNPEEDLITFTPYAAFSMDINADGIIEIPLLEEVTPDASYADMAYRTVWNRWNGDVGLLPVYYTYDDYDAGYGLHIPDSWKSSLQIDKNSETGETSFYYVNQKGKKLAELASIRYYNKSNKDEVKKKLNESKLKYIDLGTKYDRYYVGIIPDYLDNKMSEKERKQYEQMKIDLEYLQNNIKLIER